IVGLIVTVPAIANHVDDDVTSEVLPVREGHIRNTDTRLGVVSVDVENRRLNHAGDIGCVSGGTGIVGQRRETDLIVDDEVDSAPRAIAIELRKIQRLGYHALADESRISVD